MAAVAVPEGLISYLWVAATAVLAPALFGAGIVRWLGLRPGDGRRAFWAHGYLAGHLALAPVTFLWLAANKPVAGFVLPVSAATAGAVALLLHRLHRLRGRSGSAQGGPPDRPPDRAPDRAMALVALLCSVPLIDGILFQNLQPAVASDFADIWAAKAKVLYSAPGFDLAFGLGTQVRHPDYPLLNPLAQVLAFASADRVLWFENRLPIQASGLALLLLMSSSLRRRIGATVAATALVAFAGSCFLRWSTTGYADVMVAFALFAAVSSWVRWQETSEPVHWRLACLALAALVATKNEGAMLAVVFLLALGIGRLVQRRSPPPRIGSGFCWLLVPAVALGLGRWFNLHWGCTSDLFDAQLSGGRGLFARILDHAGDRPPEVARYYAGLLIDPFLGCWTVPLLLAAAAARGRRALGRPGLQVLLVVLGGLFGYALVFVGTQRDLAWHLPTAAERTVLHVLPVAVLGLCIHLGDSPARLPAAAAGPVA